MNYCSNCGSDQIQWEIPKGDNRQRHVCHNCGLIFYKNPRIITGVMPIWKNQVLLGKRAIEPRKGMWNLPAGFMECQETLEEGAVRELFEETCAKVTELKPYVLYSIPHVNQVYVIFKGLMTSPEFTITTESTDVQLFSADNIPWKDIAFSSSEFTLRKWAEKPNDTDMYIGSFTKENE